MSFKCDLCNKILKSAHGLTAHRDSNVCKKAQAQALRQRPEEPLNQAHAAEKRSLQDRIIESRKAHAVLRHVPTGARRACAEVLRKVITDCVEKNDENSWAALMLFALDNLHAPPSNSGRGPTLAASVKANLQGTTLPTKARKSRKKRSGDEALRKAVNAKLQDGDISGAVKLLTSDESVAAMSGEVLQSLKDKHPAAPADLNFPSPPPAGNPQEFTTEEVHAALKSFPAGSAAGPDGLRAQHLKELVKVPGECGEMLLAALTKLVNHIIFESIPESVRTVLFGATLIPLNKKSGGIRPIAIGCTIRRLCGKVISKRVQSELGGFFRPVQLGYGTRGGAEAAVHVTRKFLRAHPASPTVILKLDFRNAFNTIRRDVVLKEAAERIPQYYHFISQSYKESSTLFCGDTTILSANGVQQGDPLGPLLFCLGSNKLTRSLRADLNVWYLDDGTEGGDPEVVLDDLITIQNEASKLGLQLNFAKCELYVYGGSEEERLSIYDRFNAVAPGIQLITPETLELLGAPLTDWSIERVLDNKISQIKRLTESLGVLPAHQSLFLLRNSMSLPRLMYILRSAPCYKYSEKLREFDAVIKSKAEEITNVKMDDATYAQASLPVKSGGLGLPKAEEISTPAYLSSLYATDELVNSIVPDDCPDDRLDVEHQWEELTRKSAPAIGDRSNQRLWSDMLTIRKLEALRENADVIASARLLAVSTKDASAWLLALPVASLGTLLDDTGLRVAVALRMGAPICKQHKCRCGETVDAQGLHGLSCLKSQGRFRRHASLNSLIQRSLGSAKVPTILEPPGLCRSNGKRPDGLSLFPWKNGLPLIWDVTVCDTFAISYIAGSSETAGSAAEDAEERKRRNYEELTDRYFFQPVSLETMGSCGASTRQFINEVGRRIKDQTGEVRATDFLWQRISVEIQRGNAASVLGTVGCSKELEELFYLF